MKTARDFQDYLLKDDATETGGIAFTGETLYDFLCDVGLDLDAPMDVVNDALEECGIERINED